MRSRVVLAALAVAALTVTATACGPENSDPASGKGAAPTTAAAASTAPPAAASPTAAATPAKSAKPGAATSASASASGGKSGYGQACGANDLTFGAKMETQAGGYIQISAKAKPGITCVLPGEHPVIAFGSGGIEAANAEQAVGRPITLTGSAVAYAGINPKSTNNDQVVEFKDVIIGVGAADPNPASIPVGSVKVDKPVVTNWHTDAKDAVPGV
ncbi:DUF4232 domain-containing protein [Kitasatospora sp. NBC_00240]|uniref:DUF4232 domain-containing protein n=1 Tax=Kitasatospora sp. NBC_00240 TaxID=2903567 RepID=UPI002253434E|nr:DUF4232 domain-containing protein [Kitasatospora sp. NBC_00240]MCX5215308.1 DUF4232 domain-containing protein [Kitasatospora sp. NBC_00240]